MMVDNQTHPGWRVCQSISMELDAVTAVLGGALFNRDASTLQEFAPLIHSIPAAWLDELGGILEEAKGFHSALETLALLSGVLFEADYGAAALAMRSLDPDSALASLERLASEAGISLNPGGAEREEFAGLFTRFHVGQYEEIGVQVNREYRLTLRLGARFCLRLMKGGDLHERFWQWLDRFYYENYGSWRISRAGVLKEQEDQVLAILGTLEKTGSRPDLSWLSYQNPVLRHPGLKSAVLDGHLRLCLWVEPIGLPDSWLLLPGMAVTSFAQAGKIIENFQAYTAGLAARAAALSDPTRLVILRLIRHIDMTNTDMADYLNLSRPTVSVHARILREAGLIRSRQEGRVVRHEIVPEEVHKLFRDLETYLDLPEK